MQFDIANFTLTRRPLRANEYQWWHRFELGVTSSSGDHGFCYAQTPTNPVVLVQIDYAQWNVTAESYTVGQDLVGFPNYGNDSLVPRAAP